MNSTTEPLWTVQEHKKITCTNAIFIEGLPGIGNVGKVAIDFLIEKTNAELITDFISETLPNSVFIGEDNLVQLPHIRVYHAKIAEKDYLFMSGDVQPTDEISSYQFCKEVLKQLTQWNVKEIITLGGIGLEDAPDEPEVYCTGNEEKYVSSFQTQGANLEVYGVVGPIIGVSGLLLGLAKKQELPAAALLAETLGHPMYLGLRGAKALLTILKKTFLLDYPLTDIDAEIEEMESDEPIKKTKLDVINKLKRVRDTNYIG